MVFADFHGVNTPAVADFMLPQSWEKIHTTDLWAGKGMLLLTMDTGA